MALKAVIFDLGGTLFEAQPGLTAEGLLARAVGAMGKADRAALGDLDPAVVGLAVRRAYLDLEEAACTGDLSPVPGELVVSRGLAGLGISLDSATARTLLAALYVPERETAQLLPGAVAMLQTLADQGYRLGIISNRMHGGSMLLDDLGYFGISHLFGGMISSCDAGYMKPHPAIYRQALEELGVEPAEAVMVGDDLRADIGGALAAGMRAVWVRRPPTRTDQPPAGVPAITRLDELPPIIARMQ